jgi:hypothetical protein
MSVTTKKGKGVVAALVGLGVICALAVTGAQAATVVYEDVGFLANPASGGFVVASAGNDSAGTFATKVSRFEISKPGTYRATLADFGFPEGFRQIGLAITSFVGGTSALGSVQGSGSFDFTAALPGTYYAALLGRSGETYGMGLYGVQVADYSTASPVPLPPAVLLFASSIALFAACGRGGRRLDDGADDTPARDDALHV